MDEAQHAERLAADGETSQPKPAWYNEPVTITEAEVVSWEGSEAALAAEPEAG